MFRIKINRTEIVLPVSHIRTLPNLSVLPEVWPSFEVRMSFVAESNPLEYSVLVGFFRTPGSH